MNKGLILSILIGYFLILVLISYLTGRKADKDTFYTGNKASKWYVVAFGMIGASLSGVTFISIPGTIANSQMTYLQIALGYILGYAIIAFVLLPLYYRLNLTSIYGFLGVRFGVITHKMGAIFFLLSRVIGASLRMYLVANVLQEFVFNELGVPFEVTVAISIALIWVYTHRAGIKTIIWTDTLQTLFMLISVGLSVYLISGELNLALGEILPALSDNDMGNMWQTEDPMAKSYWIKGLLGGMFITLGMTGVDQDMMQKNLTCKSKKEAQWNMMSFSVVLFFVNVVFVALGGLLYMYLNSNPEVMAEWVSRGSDGDELFAVIALSDNLGIAIGVFFIIGLVAAAYSSADSALTSLTTSFNLDILNANKKSEEDQIRLRKRTHIFMSIALLLTIIIFKWVKSDAVIWQLFSAANFTYGPLLGLFLFGIITKRKVNDIIPLITCLLVAVTMFFVNKFSIEIFDGYIFGSELLGINALLVILFLLAFSKKEDGIELEKEL
ncbi:MAG: sodium:solute symporter [Crocinitomicaceae bacterium]|nr:sodium:solute symporter [Crocinitomicaceae bacterium]